MGRGACDSCGRDLVVRIREEIRTAAWDPDKQTFGSSPYVGDLTGNLFIPQNPTSGVAPREPVWAFELCDTYELQAGEEASIVGIRTYVGIGRLEPIGTGETAGNFLDEIPIETPLWSFQDGWYCIGLRVETGNPQDLGATLIGPSLSTSVYGGPCARLVTPAGGSLLGGQVPGSTKPLGALGLMRGSEFRWIRGASEDCELPVYGPCRIRCMGWVYQTDPRTRIAQPNVTPPPGGAPENEFVRARPDAQFRHIGAAVTIERPRSRACGECKICDRCCRCEVTEAVARASELEAWKAANLAPAAAEEGAP